jgi:SAM-dependent methyltransferase
MRSANLEGNPPKLTAAGRASAARTSLSGAAEDFLFWLRLATWNRIFDLFDREHGTETRGNVSLKRLGILHPVARFGVGYQPIDPGVFRRAIHSLPSEMTPGELTFVDLGCGKGRALILAGELSFRELVGIDISPSLVECARQNLARARIANARVICRNAARYQFPPGNLLVYMFHPFAGPVFRQAMRNLCRSASADVWMVYINPVERAILEEKPCFVPWVSCATFAIYRHQRHSPR